MRIERNDVWAYANTQRLIGTYEFCCLLQVFIWTIEWFYIEALEPCHLGAELRGGTIVEDVAEASHLILQHMGQLVDVGATPNHILGSWFWVLECCEADDLLSLEDPVRTASLP